MSGAGEDQVNQSGVLVLTWDDARLAATVEAVLATEQCLVLPTDTVYGIAARADSAVAVGRLQAAKGRDHRTPPPVLIGDLAELDELVAAVPETAHRLAAAHWPGALTLIFALSPDAPLCLGPGVDSVALRLPGHDRLRRLLRQTGPLATSSANRHDEVPATTVDEAIGNLQHRVALYVDGGPTPGRIPSTIVSFVDDPAGRLVRWGRLDPDELRRLAPDLVRAGVPAPEATTG